MAECACPIFGDFSYLTMIDEYDFGAVTTSTTTTVSTQVYVPVLSNNIQLQDNRRSPQVFTGVSEDFDTIQGPTQPQGQIVCPLYGWRNASESRSIAEYLFNWALTPLSTLCGLPSKRLEWAEGPDVANKSFLGMTVGGWTLSGSDDATAAITLALELMGRTESNLSTAVAIPSGLASLSEFQFSNVTFSMGADSGSLVEQPLRSFQWQGNRNLQPAYMGSTRPRYLRAGKPTSTLGIVIEKCDDTWDVYRRTATPTTQYGRLVLKGLHQGTGSTGNYAVVTISFPKLSLQSVGENYVRNGVLVQNLGFSVQKPTVAAASFSHTWTESA